MNFNKLVKNVAFLFLIVVVLFLISTIIYLNKDKSFCEIKTTILAGLQRGGQSGVLLSNSDYIQSVCK